MAREIALDTETTGLSPEQGDRLVEIGCVELENYIPTGRTYHCYINPERSVPQGAVDVHGLTDEFLFDKPKFREVYKDFLEFIGDSKLVIHNAAFDMKFINAELLRVKQPVIPMDRAIDTLLIARKKFKGSPANLDALCKRFNISLTTREDRHGALIDSELLAKVYLELMGGSQTTMLQGEKKETATMQTTPIKKVARKERHFPVPEAELAVHQEFLKQIKDPMWNDG